MQASGGDKNHVGIARSAAVGIKTGCRVEPVSVITSRHCDDQISSCSIAAAKKRPLRKADQILLAHGLRASMFGFPCSVDSTTK
jgi:hypothetical protein